jgi:hypothetical protein
VTLRVEQQALGRRIGDVVAKRLRGEAANHLLESGVEPSEPGELVALLGERWPADLAAPTRPDKPWTLTLIADD